MKYKLAKELYDAGFPQDGNLPPRGLLDTSTGFSVKLPTLSELIAACGLNTFTLDRLSNGVWYAYQHGNPRRGEGATPEEAVARLWLALNPPTN